MRATQQAARPVSSLPRGFRKIRLELAREPGHPLGDTLTGYTIVAPLDLDGRIDLDSWRKYRNSCRVVRFRPNEEDNLGHLVHRSGASWAFHYDLRGTREDESGFHFDRERFEQGEYVSVREDGEPHTFKVASVEPV
jgi:hypothetical protein